jgi:hypothetical protein
MASEFTYADMSNVANVKGHQAEHEDDLPETPTNPMMVLTDLKRWRPARGIGTVVTTRS